jgi:nucleotide-binding universal stress UspA family protein
MTTQLSPVARFDNILIATDGSGFSIGAVRVAVAMAGKCGARLLALSVVVSNPEYDALTPEFMKAAEETAQSHLKGIREKAGTIECELLVVHGASPYQEIVDAAERHRADIIVVGSHGRTGLMRAMMGSVAARVIGHAPCDVLVVPAATVMWGKGILLASDGSRYGDAAAVTAGRLARLCGLPLTVLCVTESAVAGGDVARETVHRIETALAAEGMSVRTLVREGRPDRAIVQAARDTGADLIVMGSHGHTGLERLLMGSVAERVIGHAECPVLVVKSA